MVSKSYVSVGQLGGREQANFEKCSQNALESALRNRGALPVILYTKSTLESTLGSTPESTPISDSTLESTLGALSEIFRVLNSPTGQQTRKPKGWFWRMLPESPKPEQG